MLNGMKAVSYIAVLAIVVFSTVKLVAGETRGNVMTLNDSNFGKEIKKGIVLVDFWATWCGPCKRQGPIIDEVAIEARGRARFGKLDVDKNPNVSNLYQVASIPTIIIYKDGKPARKLVGLSSKQEILDALSKVENKE